MTHNYSIMLLVGTDCLIPLPAPAAEMEEEKEEDEESNKTLMLNRLAAGSSG